MFIVFKTNVLCKFVANGLLLLLRQRFIAAAWYRQAQLGWMWCTFLMMIDSTKKIYEKISRLTNAIDTMIKPFSAKLAELFWAINGKENKRVGWIHAKHQVQRKKTLKAK